MAMKKFNEVMMGLVLVAAASLLVATLPGLDSSEIIILVSTASAIFTGLAALMTARAAKAAEHAASQWRDIKRCDVVLGYVEESISELFLYNDYLCQTSGWLNQIAETSPSNLLVKDRDAIHDLAEKTLSCAGKIYRSSRLAITLSKENTEVSLRLLDSISESQSELSLALAQLREADDIGRVAGKLKGEIRTVLKAALLHETDLSRIVTSMLSQKTSNLS